MRDPRAGALAPVSLGGKLHRIRPSAASTDQGRLQRPRRLKAGAGICDQKTSVILVKFAPKRHEKFP